MATSTITGKIFVLPDNIDTDQIIPAQYLNLVPTVPEEYDTLGSYALAGLPEGFPPFVEKGAVKTAYPIIVAGRNFGCGSSREHAPISLGAAGVKAVVAESFARIFFRNCMATGELYPVESSQRLCETLKTGMEVTVDLEANTLTVDATGNSYPLNDLGDAKAVIAGGGLFEYARQSGMI
ncbi:MAG: 3-isopropylmalate dehydratase [Candidatus Pacebacteria bacterium]|nr:3-isopropylmalate dehydratase [Candidatus Paceibacterota bacterium]